VGQDPGKIRIGCGDDLLEENKFLCPGSGILRLECKVEGRGLPIGANLFARSLECDVADSHDQRFVDVRSQAFPRGSQYQIISLIHFID